MAGAQFHLQILYIQRKLTEKMMKGKYFRKSFLVLKRHGQQEKSGICGNIPNRCEGPAQCMQKCSTIWFIMSREYIPTQGVNCESPQPDDDDWFEDIG